MKIFNNPNINRVTELYNRNKRATERVKHISTPKDQIEISAKAKDFQVAMKAFKKLPDVREDKVAEIKEKIQNNNYNVSGKEIAHKIIEGIMMDKKI